MTNPTLTETFGIAGSRGGIDIANWVLASIVLRNLQIPVEDGVMVWLSDGGRPINAEG